MHPRARRLLRRTFIAAFFLIAPAIILSTAGYRYNFSKNRLERTGALLVESRPDGASVTLNGKPQKSVTPARLQKLTPGTYAVKVAKVGYHAWEKSVRVESSVTAFLNEITLFRSAAPTLLSETPGSGDEAFSPDARYAATMVATPSGSELVIVDLRDGQETRPYRSSAEISSFRLSWDRDGRHLLIRRVGDGSEHLAWNAADRGGLTDLSEETGLAIDDAFWSQDDDRLYAVAGTQMHEIDLGLMVAAPVGPGLASPVVVGGYVYGIRAGEPVLLVRRRLRGTEEEVVAELPSADYAPLRGRGGKIAYVSTVSERLFVIDPARDLRAAFENRGRGGAWSADGQRLLYWNDLEVRLYDAGRGTDELVARRSGPVRQAAWHRPEWNALYAAGGALFAVETADRSGRVTVPLAEFSELASFALSRNGDVAYVFGTREGKAGLWRLRLR